MAAPVAGVAAAVAETEGTGTTAVGAQRGTVTAEDVSPVRVVVEGAPRFVPAYATERSAGADLRAAVEEAVLLQPGERKLIPTGVRCAIPPGFEGQVRPRSGLAIRYGVTLVNAPGTIDSDYRGEVGVVLINHGSEPFRIQPGERIAQMVIAPVTRVEFVDGALDESNRGTGGFGSTGRA